MRQDANSDGRRGRKTSPLGMYGGKRFECAYLLGSERQACLFTFFLDAHRKIQLSLSLSFSHCLSENTPSRYLLLFYLTLGSIVQDLQQPLFSNRLFFSDLFLSPIQAYTDTDASVNSAPDRRQRYGCLLACNSNFPERKMCILCWA